MTITNLQGTVTLRNGVPMPYFGLGVFQMEEGKETVEAVKHALQFGYRLIDTAANYGNEEGVAAGIMESGINRKEIFITTKIWNTDQGYESTLRAFDRSCKKLKTDFIDLYLIHWPIKEKTIATWKALERLYAEKRVRAIGVSNFRIHQLKHLLSYCNEPPAVNQIEFHPRFVQHELITFCRSQNIQIEAYSPLMQGKVFRIPQLKTIAQKHNKTTAQIVLRWILQNGIVAIPKSSHSERMKENAEIFNFVLTLNDMQAIDALNKNERVEGSQLILFFKRVLKKLKIAI